MTRINSAIKVRLLTDEHLLAEHREIKRLPSVYKKRLDSKKDLNNLPSAFTLGTGHVKFFYDKILYLRNRYKRIHSECIRRGFDVQNYEDSFSNIPERLMNNYIETESDRKIILERIASRLKKNSWQLRKE